MLDQWNKIVTKIPSFYLIRKLNRIVQQLRKRLPPYIDQRLMPLSIYTTLSLFLFFSLFFILDIYIFHLKVETSVVTVPIETMTAPAVGYIRDVLIEPGSFVKKGDLLVRIENIDLERDARLAEVQINDTKLSISYLQQLLNNEQDKLAIYKSIGSNRVVSTQANLNSSQQELIAAKNNLQRMKALLKQHYITNADWDTAETKYKNAEEHVKSALADVNIENNSLAAVGNGLYFTGQKLEGMGGDLNAQIEAAQKRLELDENRLAIYQDLLKKLNLMAPFDGKVTEVLKTAGNTTDTVKPILLIAKLNAKKTITAYLTQSEISRIHLTNKVKIYIPSVDRTFHGHIKSMDRTAGFVDEMNAQYRWRNLELDRSAQVIIEINNEDQSAFDKKVIAGMPAVIYFKRKFSLM